MTINKKYVLDQKKKNEATALGRHCVCVCVHVLSFWRSSVIIPLLTEESL